MIFKLPDILTVDFNSVDECDSLYTYTHKYTHMNLKALHVRIKQYNLRVYLKQSTKKLSELNILIRTDT